MYSCPTKKKQIERPRAGQVQRHSSTDSCRLIHVCRRCNVHSRISNCRHINLACATRLARSWAWYRT